MWFFKKKVAVEPAPKKKKSLRYTDTNFKVGKTLVKVELEDGRFFSTVIYGEIYQYVDQGSAMGIDYVRAAAPNVNMSIDMAKNFVRNLSGQEVTLVDDAQEPLISVVGRPIRAEILNTYDYETTFRVASVVEE